MARPNTVEERRKDRKREIPVRGRKLQQDFIKQSSHNRKREIPVRGRKPQA